MYFDQRALLWRFIIFCNERRLFAEQPLMLDTAFQMLEDFDAAERARLTPTDETDADKPE